MINKEHNNFIMKKIKRVNFNFEQLFETLNDPEIDSYGKREMIELNEIFAALETIELFCYTHDDFLRFNNEFVDDARIFYHEVYTMIVTDDEYSSYLKDEYEEYKKAYDMTIELMEAVDKNK